MAAMNPCKCGYLGHPHGEYLHAQRGGQPRRRISGPLLDRIDLRGGPALWNTMTLLPSRGRAERGHPRGWLRPALFSRSQQNPAGVRTPSLRPAALSAV